jgi:hypothetical protein
LLRKIRKEYKPVSVSEEFKQDFLARFPVFVEAAGFTPSMIRRAATGSFRFIACAGSNNSLQT